MKSRYQPGALVVATVVLASALAGCRSITIVSFQPQSTQVDSVIVDTDSTKAPIRLSGLDQSVGFYDLSGPTIHITVSACVGKTLVARADVSPSVPVDHILITLMPLPPGTPCPQIAGGDVTYPQPEAGSGGAAGAREMGGAGGAGGVGGGSGGGGEAGHASDDDGGAAGVGDAGLGGAGGGNGGASGAGGGPSTVDGGLCEPPSGPADPAPTLTPSAACIQYCDQIIGPRDGGDPLCPGSYADVSECQRYCALVAWPAGVNGDMSNSMGCRLYKIQLMVGHHDDVYCGFAGPSGGPGTDANGCGYNSGGPCATFCTAWGKICGVADVAPCVDACERAPKPQQPACRYNWLLRAVSDRNYCRLVDFSSACRLPDC